MGVWVNSLRHGGFTQGKKVLKTPDGDNCCLGVRYEVEGVPPVWDSIHNVFRYHNDVEVPNRVTVEKWELEEEVTVGEIEKIMAMFGELRSTFDGSPIRKAIGLYNRSNALTVLNDQTDIGFNGIARILEELGWDNSNG